MVANETSIYTALLVAAAILGLILVFFVISLARQHRLNVQLHREKIEAQVNALENERKRMAVDLHDEIGPMLSAVKLLINSLDTAVEDDLELIASAGKYIDEMLGKIRGIANNLVPAALVRKGFYVATAEFLKSINHSSGLHADYVFESAGTEISKEKEIHLYRIIQEITHNIIKHADATNIWLSVAANPKEKILLINIRDNGKGFDYKTVINENNGLGLRNILNRVEILNGILYIDTEKGEGVSYSIEIPIT
jgi:signal transduction histidine kinase